MKRTHSRALSLLLAVVMVLSMLPATALAADSATTWTRVDFSAITAEDTVAITMTKDGTTYVLPTVGSGGSGQPLADAATVEGDTLTTAGDGYGWTIAPTEGGYTISTEAGYLYTTNTNNGTRIGETVSVWNVDAESGYLATTVSDTVRYLGVYIGGLDWRCYKTWATGNTAGQDPSRQYEHAYRERKQKRSKLDHQYASDLFEHPYPFLILCLLHYVKIIPRAICNIILGKGELNYEEIS